MTPYATAQLEAVKHGFLLVEAAVTQPIGLTYDLRATREALFPGTQAAPEEKPEESEAPAARERPRVPLPQALEALAIAQRQVAALLVMGALDSGWAERARKVLDRASLNLGARLRGERAGRLRGLYVILDPQQTRGSILDLVAAALKGGAVALQLRDKVSDKGAQLTTARRLLELCAQHNALLIINDHADLTALSGAHGLHVGQHDLHIPGARSILAPGQLIGRSNATVEEALEAQQLGADYIAVGSIFPTTTKDKIRPAGLETLRRVRDFAQVPLVAIGGINESNVEQVIEAGADAAAVISAVASAPDPEEAARRLTDKIHGALGRRKG